MLSCSSAAQAASLPRQRRHPHSFAEIKLSPQTHLDGNAVFAGMVPLDFSSHFPEAALLDQGLWCGGFRRPPLLLPGQPLYDRVADGFYRLTREHFGDTAYFSVDPFHEGGECSGVDLADYGSRTLEKMQQHRPIPGRALIACSISSSSIRCP